MVVDGIKESRTRMGSTDTLLLLRQVEDGLPNVADVVQN